MITNSEPTGSAAPLLPEKKKKKKKKEKFSADVATMAPLSTAKLGSA
jgi:hypothetical protein